MKKEEAVGLYKKRFPVQEKDLKSKKVNGCLDTLHGYDFYEVENRQYENWLEAKESNIRGHERSLNARNGEISRLKKKVERAVQKIRDFCADIKRKREKKRRRKSKGLEARYYSHLFDEGVLWRTFC